MNLILLLHVDPSKVTDPALVQSQLDSLHAYCRDNQLDLLTRFESYHDASWKWSDQTLQLIYDLLWNDQFKTQKTEHITAAVSVSLATDLPTILSRVKEALSHDDALVILPSPETIAIRRTPVAQSWLKKRLTLRTLPDPTKHLKDFCDYIGLIPRTLVEVGAAHPDTYRLGEFTNTSSKVILVEANPRLFYCLKWGYDDGNFMDSWGIVDPKDFSPPPHAHPGLDGIPNVTIHHAAVADGAGQVVLFEANASSYVGGLASPARVNDGFQETVKDARVVPSITIDSIDDGTIDVLLADCEGSEWFCLKHLKSRPKLIVLELSGGAYTNPFAREILEWMTTNGYGVGGHGATDSWFVRRD